MNIKYFLLIDKKDTLHYNIIEYNLYKFKLLYRASRDGNTAPVFHGKCDNINGATIFIAKARNLKYIIGG